MNEPEPQSVIVMGHIVDMKEKLAKNTADTTNIKETLNKIEGDLKTFGTLFLTHNEFKPFSDASSDHETRLRGIEKNVWRAIGALTILQIIVLPALFYLLFKT